MKYKTNGENTNIIIAIIKEPPKVCKKLKEVSNIPFVLTLFVENLYIIKTIDKNNPVTIDINTRHTNAPILFAPSLTLSQKVLLSPL